MHIRVLLLAFHFTIGYNSVAQDGIPVTIAELANLTLDESPSIQQSLLAVKHAQGSERVQRSAFDYYLTSSIGTNRSVNTLFSQDPRNESLNGDLRTNEVSSSVGLNKSLRTGQTIRFDVGYLSRFDNYTLNRFNESIDPNVRDHYTTGSIAVIQPLLRGRGGMVATAQEKSAQLSLKSTQSDLSFNHAVQVRAMANAYWQYQLAYQSFLVYQENEARVRRVLEVTEDLVKGEKKPRAELLQVEADLANQKRLTDVANQNLITARLNLGRVVGLSEEDSQLIGVPEDDFPSVDESGYGGDLSLELMQQMAKANRKDIEANQLTSQSLALLIHFADNQRKAQLNLRGAMNYGGASMGNNWSDVGDSFTSSQGRDVGFEVGLTFDIPVNNNRAQGTFLESQARFEDQQVQANNLIRNVDLNVSIALNNIENSASILLNARKSFEHYQQVYENEKTRFRNGRTTLLNLIIFQERLTYAQLEYLQARQRYGLAIIELRFETGTLYAQNISSTGGLFFTSDVFYKIPSTH